MSYRTDLMKLVFRALGEGSEEEGKKRIVELYEEGGYVWLADLITNDYKIPVNRQNVRYWVKVAKSNKAFTDRDMAAHIEIKPIPSLLDEQFEDEKVYQRILVLGDDHEPYGHPDKFDFLRSVCAALEPDLVVHVGDEVDHHAMSMHDSDPNLDSAGPELYKARERLRVLADMFPNMLLCHSNHGSMAYRRALKHGIPVEYIKDYSDVLFPGEGKPNWKWADEWRVHTPMGEVLFRHQFPGNPVAAACHEGCNVVYGHYHSEFRIIHKQSSGRLYYGANCGCLADPRSLAFRYNVNMKDRPVIGILAIVGGLPMLRPMPLDKYGRWLWRSK